MGGIKEVVVISGSPIKASEMHRGSGNIGKNAIGVIVSVNRNTCLYRIKQLFIWLLLH